MRHSPLLSLLLILFSVLSFSNVSAIGQLDIDPTPTDICDVQPTHPSCATDSEDGWYSPPADPNGAISICDVQPTHPSCTTDSEDGFIAPSDRVPDWCLNNPDPICQSSDPEIEGGVSTDNVPDWCLNNPDPLCDLVPIDTLTGGNKVNEYPVNPNPELVNETNPLQAKEPNLWQRMLENAFSDVLGVAIVAIFTALGAYLIPSVRKRISKLLGRDKPLLDATAEAEQEEQIYP